MKQAMIFAAGLGTRLQPLTNNMPKALVPVCGKPLLWHVLSKLAAAGYERVVVNVHHFPQQILDYLDNNRFPLDVRISDESEQLLETGGGVKRARPLFSDEGPVLLHNVDILSNVDFSWLARQHEPDDDALLLVSRRKTKRYLLFDNGMRLMGWTNVETGEVRSPFPWLRESEFTIGEDFEVVAPADSPLFAIHASLHAFAFSGIHSFSPRLFPLMDRFPDRFGIMDFYLSICHRSRIVGCLKPDLRLLDVGKLDSLSAAEAFVQSES